MRTARPLGAAEVGRAGRPRSMKVAAILPQSRNLRARLPRRQPVTTAMASVAQRSISTKVTRRLRSGDWGRGGRRCRGGGSPSMAMRTPRIWPAQRWPWAAFAFSSNVLKDSMGAPSS